MMQKVTFKIKRLGAIRDSSMTLSPLMIFSGESGLGKSYAAFLVHYLYTILLDNTRLGGFFKDNGDLLKELPGKAGTVILSIPKKLVFDWINKDAVSYIGYLIGNQSFDGDVSIIFPSTIMDSSFDFYYNEEMRGLDDHEELFYRISLWKYSYSVISNEYNKKGTEPYVALLRAHLLDLIFGDINRISKSFLLPPSRGSLMEINERPIFQSGMYQEFFDLKALINAPQKTVPTLNPQILASNNKVIEGEVVREPGTYAYKMNSGKVMPLTAAASSIKELSPLTLFLNKFPVNNVSILFEEPEAHIHPNRQVHLADLLACIINDGGHLQITTHSDYLIKRLNNLMKLSLLEKKMESHRFATLLSKFDIQTNYLLSPENVKAYLLRDNGDGSSSIVEQKLEDGTAIPFASFYSVIKEDFRLTQSIEEEEQKLEGDRNVL